MAKKRAQKVGKQQKERVNSKVSSRKTPRLTESYNWESVSDQEFLYVFRAMMQMCDARQIARAVVLGRYFPAQS
jgi:hypothetical protein